MKLHFDEDTAAFREELLVWLDRNYRPPEVAADPQLSVGHLPEWAREWQRKLFKAGWLAPGWPPEMGGRHATPIEQMVYLEELERRGIRRSYNNAGLAIIAPCIIDFGNAEQKERFAIPTLWAEISWCIGMSEPGAGSDFGSLSTRAVLDGDEFIVNGQKVWTSGAQHSDYCWCFVRTDPTVPKHKGISVLIVDMKSPGITCRPIPLYTDRNHADFNEVFFTDVVVPRANLVGDLNNGWAISLGSLAHERGLLWVRQAMGLQRALDSFRQLADLPAAGGGRLGDDPAYRDALATLYVDVNALSFMGYRGQAQLARTGLAAEHSLLKLLGGELEQRIAHTALEILGARGLEPSPEVDFRARGVQETESSWALQYLESFDLTIGGGTSEIQRNIIAERIMGLPRS